MPKLKIEFSLTIVNINNNTGILIFKLFDKFYYNNIIIMAVYGPIIPAKRLMAPDAVFYEFEKQIKSYSGRMKIFINNSLKLLQPMQLIHCFTIIQVDKIMGYVTSTKTQGIPDKYTYEEMQELFQHFKQAHNFQENNLINYILTPITNELCKLDYNVTVGYKSTINGKDDYPITITLKWNHLSD